VREHLVYLHLVVEVVEGVVKVLVVVVVVVVVVDLQIEEGIQEIQNYSD